MLELNELSGKLLPSFITQVLCEIVRSKTDNPRGMKRVVNLLQIIACIGKLKRRDNYLSDLPIANSHEKEEGHRFLKKCVLWIFLCQCFPFRMSVLVQVILDFDQKKEFNDIET